MKARKRVQCEAFISGLKLDNQTKSAPKEFLGIDCLFSLNLIVIFFSPRNSVFFHTACINTSFVCKLET